MVQVRVQTKGMDLNKIAEEIGQDIRDLKKNTLISMAEVIAGASPVDSGNYARNHEVALRSGSFQAGGIRPDSDSRISRDGAAQYPNAKEEGLRFMLEDIQQVDLASENFVFRNIMNYAKYVEAEHAVYSRARREVGQILAAEVAKVRNR